MQCKACSHPRHEQIDRALAEGQSLAALAKRFGISKTGLWRHRKHLGEVLASATEAHELVRKDKLVLVVRGLIADLEKLKRQAQAENDIRTATKVIDSALKGVLILARLEGLVSEGVQHAGNEVHVTNLISDAALFRVAEFFVKRKREELPAAGEVTLDSAKEQEANLPILEEAE